MILYFERSIFLAKYDAVYIKDRYEHSQYALPLSKRGIGDDTLYAYAAYKMLHGTDPINIVFDKPVTGIYMIAVAIAIFNNPAYSGLFFGLGSCMVLFLIGKKLFQRVDLALAAVLLFILDPLVFNHVWKSLLDVIQLFFLFLHVYLFLFVLDKKEKKNLLYLFLSGILLGISAQIKIPTFLPIILGLEYLFFVLHKAWKEILVFSFSIIFSLVIAYLFYIPFHYSFIQYLKIQKYILSFYLISELKAHPEAIWQLIFTGTFPDILSRVPGIVEEWSLIIPLASIIALPASLLFLIKRGYGKIWVGMGLFIIGNLLVYTYIPTYPRYLVLVLPFIYLIFIKITGDYVPKQVFKIACILLGLYGLWNSLLYLSPKPSAFLRTFSNSFSHQYFQDVYQEDILRPDQLRMSRESFRFIAQSAINQARIRAIKMNFLPNTVGNFDSTGKIPVEITYFTEYLGPITERKEIEIVKQDSRWKVKWDWGYTMNGFTPGETFSSTREIGERGRITNKAGVVIAADQIGHLISVDPYQINTKQEKALLQLLNRISLLKESELQNAYLENTLPHTYVPLFTTPMNLIASEKEQLLTFSGVKIEEYATREYNGMSSFTIKNIMFDECCTRVYSSYNYHGNNDTKSPELIYDNELSGYDGGSLLLLDKQGNVKRVIISKKPKTGANIQLTN